MERDRYWHCRRENCLNGKTKINIFTHILRHLDAIPCKKGSTKPKRISWRIERLSLYFRLDFSTINVCVCFMCECVVLNELYFKCFVYYEKGAIGTRTSDNERETQTAYFVQFSLQIHFRWGNLFSEHCSLCVSRDIQLMFVLFSLSPICVCLCVCRSIALFVSLYHSLFPFADTAFHTHNHRNSLKSMAYTHAVRCNSKKPMFSRPLLNEKFNTQTNT